jgi:hypothetical protein
VEKKRPMRLTMHQGFLRNREGAQRVNGAGESMRNSHGGTVHHGREQREMQRSQGSYWGRICLGARRRTPASIQLIGGEVDGV